MSLTLIRIFFLWLFTFLFNRKRMSDFVERLDDKLSNEFSTEKREFFVNSLNAFISKKPVYRLIQSVLRRALRRDHIDIPYTIDLDPKEYLDREARRLDVRPNRRTWSNWVGTHTAEPLGYLFPGTGPHRGVFEKYKQLSEYDFIGLKQVQRLVQYAESRNLRIKCVASGHALSDVAVTTDLLLSTKSMTRPQRRARQPYIKEKYRNGYVVETQHGGSRRKENRWLFETGAGTLIVDIKRILREEGLAFQNLGGSDVQGLMGAISTSTHGTGFHLPPFPDMVKSLVLVSSGGKAWRIEPADGITDPGEYMKSEEWLKYGIELLQDDDRFYSAICSMGCFGVIFSVVLEVMDFYYLHEDRIPSTWEEEREKILREGMSYLEKNRHISWAINPYSTGPNGKFQKGAPHFCVVNRVNYSALNQEEERKVRRRDHSVMNRNFLSSLLSGIYIAAPISAWLFNRKPKSIPQFITGSLQRIVDHKASGRGFKNIYYDVLNQGLQQMKFYGYAIEIAFPLEKNKFVEAIDRMLKLAEEIATDYSQYQPAPLAIRFVDRSKAYLSMMYDQPSCTVEVVSIIHVVGGQDVLERIERDMYAFGGRPHWGLSLDTMNRKLAERLYPKLPEWLQAFAFFNATGVFNNVFTERMGFSEIKDH